MVDEDFNVSLLEVYMILFYFLCLLLGAYCSIFILHELNIQVNPGPDFKQTGGKLQRIIMELWLSLIHI